MSLRDHYIRFVDRIRAGLPRISITPPAARIEAAHSERMIGIVEATATWPLELRTALLGKLPAAAAYQTVDAMRADLDARLRHAAGVHDIIATAERGIEPAARAAIRKRGATCIEHRVPIQSVRSMVLDQLAEEDEQLVVDTTLAVPGDKHQQPLDPAAVYAARSA